MKLFALLLVVLTFIASSSQTCSRDIHLARTNSTIYFCDVNGANTTFVLSKSPSNSVDWTLEGKRYKVLGSEECLPGQGYTHDAENFICNPDLSKTTDQLGQLLLLCSGSNNLPVFTGVEWVCGNDLDLLLTLNCQPGWVPKAFNNTWVCAPDSDRLVQMSLNCTQPWTPIYSNGQFICSSASANGSDTLRDLIQNCAAGQIPKFMNGVWTCAEDQDFLPTHTCPDGLVLKSTGSGWGCGTDRDTFVQELTANCSALGTGFDTPMLTENGWTCIEVPTYNVSSTLGTVLYVNVYKFDEVGTLTETFVGFYPFAIPYKGTLKAFGLRPVPVDGNTANVVGQVKVNGVPVPETRIQQSFPDFGIASVQGLAIPVNAGDTFDVELSSTGSIVYISTEIYIQLDSSPAK